MNDGIGSRLLHYKSCNADHCCRRTTSSKVICSAQSWMCAMSGMCAVQVKTTQGGRRPKQTTELTYRRRDSVQYPPLQRSNDTVPNRLHSRLTDKRPHLTFRTSFASTTSHPELNRPALLVLSCAPIRFWHANAAPSRQPQAAAHQASSSGCRRCCSGAAVWAQTTPLCFCFGGVIFTPSRARGRRARCRRAATRCSTPRPWPGAG